MLVKSEELLSAVYDALFCCESTMIARVIQEVLYSQYGCSCISFMLCVHHMQSLNTLTGFLCVCVCVCVCDSQLQYPGCRFTYISVVTFCCICENKQMIKFYIMAWILSVRSNVSTYIYIHTHTHTHTFTDVKDTLEAATYWTVFYWDKKLPCFLIHVLYSFSGITVIIILT